MKNKVLRVSQLCFVLMFVLTFLCSCGSEEAGQPEPTPAPYAYAVKIAYAYKEREAITTRFGEIVSYDTYLVYGLLHEDGRVTETRELCDYYYWDDLHSINISQSEYSYLWVVAQDGKVLDYDFYLTSDMLENIGGTRQ